MIGLISINYNNASLQIRERFSFTDREIPEFYKFVMSKVFLDGVFILSTCNRTEIYFEKEDSEKTEEEFKTLMIEALSEFKHFEEDITPHIYSDFNKNAVQHFFSVVSGLKSLIFGEYQIVSQIKEAYYVCQTNHMLGTVLEKMIHKAFETGKNVRSQTDISKGAMSVSSAAVQISLKKYTDPKAIKALIVGTGETGQLVIESLKKKGCTDITLCNRTYDHAVEIAKAFNSKVVEYEKMHTAAADADIVVFSTSAPKPIMTKADAKTLMANRNQKSVLLIDVGMPRNVEGDIELIDGVELFNLDKLKEVVDNNNENKKSQLSLATAIVDERVEEYQDWLKTNKLKKTFALINQAFEQVNKVQQERYKDSEVHSEIIKYGDILSKKYSKMIIKQLRIANRTGINSEALNLVEEIFDFNKEVL